MTLVEIYAVLYAFGVFVYFMWLHRIISKAEKSLLSNARNAFGLPYVMLRHVFILLLSAIWPWIMFMELTLRVGFFFMLRSFNKKYPDRQVNPRPPRPPSSTDL